MYKYTAFIEKHSGDAQAHQCVRHKWLQTDAQRQTGGTAIALLLGQARGISTSNTPPLS